LKRPIGGGGKTVKAKNKVHRLVIQKSKEA